MIPPFEYDWSVDAGAGSSTVLTYCNPGSAPGIAGAPIDVTGWTARLTVRSSYGDGAALTLTSDDDRGIVVGTTDGSFAITMTPEQTEQIPPVGVYDLLVTPVGDFPPIRLVQGTLTANQFVTRSV